MTYNGLNQLVKKTEHTGSEVVTNYTYDKSGNLITSNSSGGNENQYLTYTYDPYNRMISERRKLNNSTYKILQNNNYDHAGQRISSVHYDDAKGKVEERYHYKQGQLSCVTDGEGIKISKYIYNPEGDILLNEEKTSGNSNAYTSYIKDIRGSVKSLISENGKHLIDYNYDDYGNTGIKIAVDNYSKTGYNNHICYAGGIYDKPTGNYYLNSRYYNPDMMRFITQDTYRGAAGDATTWNLYSYCAGNPVGYVDPSGHIAIAIPLVGYIIDALGAAGAATVATAAVATVAAVCKGISDTFFPKPEKVVEDVGVGELGVIAPAPTAETKRKSNTKVLPDVKALDPDPDDRPYRLAYGKKNGELFIENIFQLTFGEAKKVLKKVKNVKKPKLKYMKKARKYWKKYPDKFGIYTLLQVHAKALAMALDIKTPPEVHDPGLYGHYNDKKHNYHIWYGLPIFY